MRLKSFLSDPGNFAVTVTVVILIPIALYLIYEWDLQSSVHLVPFDALATEDLHEGRMVDQTHLAFTGYDKICLFSRLGAKHKETAGCGLFEYPAIALIKGDQCTLFSQENIKARIYFEYDAECRTMQSGFKLFIVGKDDDPRGKSLLFVDE